MKRDLCSLLLVCLFIVLPITTFAEPYNIPEKIVPKYETQGEVIPKEVRDADIEKQINEIINELKKEDSIKPNAGDHIYTTKVVAKKYKTVGGYAGNQPAGGSRFGTGGGFFYVDSGGPSASGSVQFSVPYKLLSFSVALGVSSSNTSGIFIKAPNTYQYFKLYVSKTMEIRQVNLYKQINKNSPKVLVSISYPVTLYSRNSYARAVK